MAEQGLNKEIENEMKHYESEIRKIDVEMSRLQGKREAFEDAKTMLYGLLNKLTEE